MSNPMHDEFGIDVYGYDPIFFTKNRVKTALRWGYRFIPNSES